MLPAIFRVLLLLLLVVVRTDRVENVLFKGARGGVKCLFCKKISERRRRKYKQKTLLRGVVFPAVTDSRAGSFRDTSENGAGAFVFI